VAIGVATFYVSAGVAAVATWMFVALARGRRAQPGTLASRTPSPSAIVG
jgi:hypothetical protein